jgi:ABC-type microcin C transport system permease subunit YejB
MMPAAGIDSKSLTNAWKKTNEQELFNQLKTDYGFSQALSRSLVQLMHDHIEANYGNLRGDSQVIYHAACLSH